MVRPEAYAKHLCVRDLPATYRGVRFHALGEAGERTSPGQLAAKHASMPEPHASSIATARSRAQDQPVRDALGQSVR